MLLPLRTDRLTLRALVPDDVPVLTAYRNDPEVARFQDWELPWSRAASAELVAAQSGATVPLPGTWTQIAVEHTGELAGDLAVGLDAHGALATVGYTLRSDRQGLGLGREAVSALVDALFERTGVHRIGATLDPRNTASARLLEQVGFRYEGRSPSAARVRGTWADDDRYALLQEDRAAWLARPSTPPRQVELVEITPDLAGEVAGLATHHSQRRFVATMAGSFRDALFPELVDGVPAAPWLRAVRADGEIVAFVMLSDVTATIPEPFLWRLLVDRRHQRRGLGTRILDLVLAHVREQGHTRLSTSWTTGRGGPEPFYRKRGFVPTGKLLDGEVEAMLTLAGDQPPD